MPKILTVKQIYKLDAFTTKKHQITSLDLMEHASDVCFNWIHKRLQGNPLPIHIICGTGNNGGDGLVIARKLKKHGYNSKTYIINCDNKRSADFLTNYKRLKELGDWPVMIKCKDEFPEISENDMVIDAIFGIGLSRSPKGILKEVIQHINNSKAYVLSIDIPSGLYADKTVTDKESVVKAFQVLTFQTPKLAFLLPENEAYCNNWDVLDIGLDQEFISQQKTKFYLTEKNDVLPIYKMRGKFSHKGTYGHSLLIGGSFGKIGAVSLATKASLKIGSGLVTAYVPKCGYAIMQTTLPEAMVEVDSEKELQFFNFKTIPTVIGVGIGMGTTSKTQAGFSKFLSENKIPLVIDADGINIISKDIALLKLLLEDTVLTPHPRELERLIGTWKNDYDKLKKLEKFTKEYKIILVVKGAHTVIVHKGKFHFNTTGNPGLATAGSGDVLTGIITGLIAQGYHPMEACIFGTYIHGSTADIAMQKMVYETFTASDIIANLSNAFIDLFAREQIEEKEV